MSFFSSKSISMWLKIIDNPNGDKGWHRGGCRKSAMQFISTVNDQLTRAVGHHTVRIQFDTAGENLCVCVCVCFQVDGGWGCFVTPHNLLFCTVCLFCLLIYENKEQQMTKKEKTIAPNSTKNDRRQLACMRVYINETNKEETCVWFCRLVLFQVPEMIAPRSPLFLMSAPLFFPVRL